MIPWNNTQYQNDIQKAPRNNTQSLNQQSEDSMEQYSVLHRQSEDSLEQSSALMQQSEDSFEKHSLYYYDNQKTPWNNTQNWNISQKTPVKILDLWKNTQIKWNKTQIQHPDIMEMWNKMYSLIWLVKLQPKLRNPSTFQDGKQYLRWAIVIVSVTNTLAYNIKYCFQCISINNIINNINNPINIRKFEETIQVFVSVH